jgi:17beta-estradiol 17-dehydrogenase / very-long-chain 3-oxoacyl-CoA reductase
MLAGLNVVLVSRTKAKLDAAAEEITAAFRVQTKVVAADFSSASQTTWNELSEVIAPLDVGILVNNVGLSYDHAEYFDAIDDKLIDDLVQVNIQATNKVRY